METLSSNGQLSTIAEKVPKPQTEAIYRAVLFTPNTKDKKQIFMSSQRRFKGNYLYHTKTADNVFLS